MKITPLPPNNDDLARAEKRRELFVKALPALIIEKEDKLPKFISGINASAKTKLNIIYTLTDEISEIRNEFVACKKGCSACCYINVSITRTEAERIGSEINRHPVEINRSILHPINKFQGKACPFVDSNGECSIYSFRPLSCRKHSSFFEDDAACQELTDIKAPLLSFSGLDMALFQASLKKGKVIFADIRDFFPS